jgi:hypothetical protein
VGTDNIYPISSLYRCMHRIKPILTGTTAVVITGPIVADSGRSNGKTVGLRSDSPSPLLNYDIGVAFKCNTIAGCSDASSAHYPF